MDRGARAARGKVVSVTLSITQPTFAGGDAAILGLDVDAVGKLKPNTAGVFVVAPGGMKLRITDSFAPFFQAKSGMFLSGSFRITKPAGLGGDATVLRLDGRVGPAPVDVRATVDPASHVWGHIDAGRGIRVVGIANGAFEVQASSQRLGFVPAAAIDVVFAKKSDVPGQVPGIIALVP